MDLLHFPKGFDRGGIGTKLPSRKQLKLQRDGKGKRRELGKDCLRVLRDPRTSLPAILQHLGSAEALVISVPWFKWEGVIVTQQAHCKMHLFSQASLGGRRLI